MNTLAFQYEKNPIKFKIPHEYTSIPYVQQSQYIQHKIIITNCDDQKNGGSKTNCIYYGYSNRTFHSLFKLNKKNNGKKRKFNKIMRYNNNNNNNKLSPRKKQKKLVLSKKKNIFILFSN